ncbi:hypothetical protein CBER1_07500 [Cercospora berteroae]|uniref:MIT domain-containing protein n=1 Tax=Cercospora berteroae TaxID=357750 RepID=A0A2S6BUN7_9PEZI|nr:hypothetical protein CBER1_07500 [Cercospora berteroae]
MFDLTLTQQVPAGTLAAEAWVESTRKLVPIVFQAFQLEEAGSYGEAIKAHQTATSLLETAAKIKNVRKFNRKMYERQADIHQERIAYLEKVQQQGGKVMLVPARTSPDTSSPLGDLSANSPLSSLSSQVEEYIIIKDTDLVDVGVRSCWFFLKKFAHSPHDATELTHYVVQCIWDNEKPIIETMFRRPDEVFPLGGHLHTALLLQGDKQNFNFCMRRRGEKSIFEEPQDGIWESPTKDSKKKEWSPRTFEVEGRYFVWKNEDGKDAGLLSKKWGFETLYETTKSADEGGEIVGEKLAWGKIGGKGKGKWTIWVKEGLTLKLKEQILASQVSRLMRWSMPPIKDLAGVEKATLALTAVTGLVALGGLLG